MKSINPVGFLYGSTKNLLLRVALISLISFFMIQSHVVDFIFLLELGGILFLLIELILLPLLFIISPGMFITIFVIEKLIGLFVKTDYPDSINNDIVTLIVACLLFIVNILYYLFLSYIIRRYKLTKETFLQYIFLVIIALIIFLLVRVYKMGAILAILLLIVIVFIKRRLGK